MPKGRTWEEGTASLRKGSNPGSKQQRKGGGGAEGISLVTKGSAGLGVATSEKRSWGGKEDSGLLRGVGRGAIYIII